jgi:hypothetical protein
MALHSDHRLPSGNHRNKSSILHIFAFDRTQDVLSMLERSKSTTVPPLPDPGIREFSQRHNLQLVGRLGLQEQNLSEFAMNCPWFGILKSTIEAFVS